MPFKESIRGWMTGYELTVLEAWASELPPYSSIVEVGSFYGRSAYCFAASVHPTSKIYCFDRWFNDVVDIRDNPDFGDEIREANGFPLIGMINSLDNFLNNVKDLNNIIPKQVQSSSEINWELGKVIDLFFIDAAHHNPSDWEYITYWMPFVKSGGYICGHDYYTDLQFPDINHNVGVLEEIYKTKVETYDGTSLWRIKT
jgi:hypothetical protein